MQQFLASLLLLAALSTTAAPGHDAEASVQVIVSPALPEVTLNRSFLRAVFTMRMRQWPDGSPVRVFVLPDDNPLSDLFYREHLGMYTYVLRNAWDRMVFTGTGLAPTVVQSEQEMTERVRSTPGAIGFVRKRESTRLRGGLPAFIMALLTSDAHG